MSLARNRRTRADVAAVLPLPVSDADVVPLAADYEPAAPTTVAEAEAVLRHEFEALRGQYRPESVTALLDLLDGAAERIATDERARWSAALSTAAVRVGCNSFGDGLRCAARLIDQNRSTP